MKGTILNFNLERLHGYIVDDRGKHYFFTPRNFRAPVAIEEMQINRRVVFSPISGEIRFVEQLYAGKMRDVAVSGGHRNPRPIRSSYANKPSAVDIIFEENSNG